MSLLGSRGSAGSSRLPPCSSTTFWDKEAGAPRLPGDDEIVRGVLLTRAGAVIHPQFAQPAPQAA